MNKKLFNRFSNDSLKDKEIPKIEKKDSNVIDKEIMDYIINEFPEVSGEIMKALINLTNTLEKSIDHIEDRAYETIKVSRDFELGGRYRDTSIKLYERIIEITEFIEWMEEKDKDNNSGLEVNNELEEEEDKEKEIEIVSSVDEFNEG